MAKLGQDVISISTDNSVISMDTDNEDIEDNIFVATAGEFDLTESCPDIYRCPISKELMTKPVMLHDDGHTYDEQSLQEWLSENNRSPLTGVDLKNKSYTRNYALQSAIEQFQTAKEAHITKQKMRQKSREILGIDGLESSPTSPSDDHQQSQSGTDMDLVSQDELKQSEEDILNTLSPHVQQLQQTQDVMIYNKLKSFLSAISLDEYVSTFINAGFVSMNDFSNITFNDLVAMNIPIIHARRMITAIDKYNNDLESKLNDMPGLKDVPLTNSIIIRPGRIPKSQNSAPLNCNILLLGDAYVGKTSLRKRLELDDFVATQATQGVELTCLLSNFQGEDLQITIWDPAGQERYAPITKTFFRRAHAAAIIFSADDPTTWKHVEYWMNELETNAPDDIEFMLICNKIDLLNQDDDNGDIELNEVIKNAINVAAKKRVPFYTTSAKSGESVKQAFQELVSLLLNNHAILDKLYQQRDGNLGRGSSYHGPNPYKDRNINHNSSDDDNKGSEEDDDSSPTRRGSKKGKRMAKIKKKLSWRHKKNQSQVFTEYTEDDYAVNLDQKMNSQNDIQSNGGGCCK